MVGRMVAHTSPQEVDVDVGTLYFYPFSQLGQPADGSFVVDHCASLVTNGYVAANVWYGGDTGGQLWWRHYGDWRYDFAKVVDRRLDCPQ